MNKVTFRAELRDLTKSGRYRYIKSRTFDMPENATKRSIIIRAKKELDLTGVKCKTFVTGYWCFVELRIVNSTKVLIIDLDC